MAIHQKTDKAASGSGLLALKEQVICKIIAAGATPHSQRAVALLALNEGDTQAQAAERAGLSAGQVKYWLARFRKHRMNIFPNTLLDEPDAIVEGVPVAEIEGELEPATEKAAPANGEPEGARARKGKKDKKKPKKSEKKTRKTNKDKKEKKKKIEKKTKKATKDKKDKKGKKKKKKQS